MSDFDFDELDKAVAGAITSADVQDESKKDDISRDEAIFDSVVEDTPSDNDDLPTSDAPVNKVTADESRADVASENDGAEPSTPPAARRSGGRFMDVVHPSSDMRGGRASGFTAPQQSTRPVSASPSVASTTLQPLTDEEKSAPVENENSPAPLESPFLTGAKVKKRPLGGENPTGARSVTAETDPELLLEAPDEPRIEAHVMPDPIDFEAHSQALASENEDTGSTTDDAVDSIDDAMASKHDKPEEIPQETFDALEQLEEMPRAKGASAEVRDDSFEQAGPTSITQQYTEKPRDDEQASGSIYDTETYHQPLKPAGKKKSGVAVVLWIVGLLLLGGAASVGFYLFILPTL